MCDTLTPTADMDTEIGELLEEFEAVVEEMTAPTESARGSCETLLNDAKRRAALSDGVTDSGIEDADDGECSIISCPLTIPKCGKSCCSHGATLITWCQMTMQKKHVLSGKKKNHTFTPQLISAEWLSDYHASLTPLLHFTR